MRWHLQGVKKELPGIRFLAFDAFTSYCVSNWRQAIELDDLSVYSMYKEGNHDLYIDNGRGRLKMMVSKNVSNYPITWDLFQIC